MLHMGQGGLEAGSWTELAGVAAAILGTAISLMYTRHTFRLTQQPAWRVVVREVTYSPLNTNGTWSIDNNVGSTEWTIENVGQLGAVDVQIELRLDKRMRMPELTMMRRIVFPQIEPGVTRIIAGGTFETWPTWARFSGEIAKLAGKRIRNRVMVRWVDSAGKDRSKRLRILWRDGVTRYVAAGESPPSGFYPDSKFDLNYWSYEAAWRRTREAGQ